ncbi:hypothetical protein [Paenibacillus roseipurpureus]|uniref:Uncharacterized protein n=1 Tax=Paenibacillus roseopurpureus TaxID=2918901 RepID=A0AA96RJ98_9BACL|nr:hypothetical protein [Paenibacillus sp. MBLB1832]WNR45153.1 hypothetical protein MJB10_03090 [Paenibacillus sp. MBLB1832]
MNPSNFKQIKKTFIEDVFGYMIVSERCEVFVENSFTDASMAPIPLSDTSLEELLDTAKRSESLGTYLRQKAHQRDMITYRPALFEQGQISRDYWSRVLNDEMRASKEKLLRIAILLKLSEEEAEEMLDKAGYSISLTIPRDVVVQFCLRKEFYDFLLIEQLLADHEIQSLFNDRRGA